MEPPEQCLLRLDPHRDANDWVVEEAADYVRRMQTGPLPLWPDELLIEWLHRHNRHADRYTFLGFENLRFTKERWPLEAIPSREAFYDTRFFDNITDIKRRAHNHRDWLAKDMLARGTWNTPIVLLENRAGTITFPDGTALQSPLHLLEGHRRLSFLNGLRQLGNALPEHDVWLAKWCEKRHKQYSC